MGKGKRGSLGDKVLGKRKIDAEETRPDSDSQNIPPEAKREKREDKTLSEEPIPALGERLPRASTGFVRVPHPTDKDKHVLQFPMTESLRDAAGDRKWPAIFFGDDAPLPRWKLVALANPPDADDLEHQLITTYDDKTHIPGVHRGSHPMSYDGKIGLGALDWELEYGPESGFNGFSKEEVYEVAFRCLVDATYDFLCREEIRAWISRQKWFHVANVDDPLPPIRHPPKLTLFGRARRKDSGVYFPNFEPLGKNGRLFDDFDRPTLCLDRGTNQTRPKSPSPSNQRRRPPRDPLIEMMLKNENTTLVAPGKVSSSFNPTHDSPQPQPPSSPVLPPKAGQPHSAALSNVERGSSGRSDRPQQGGRLAEISSEKPAGKPRQRRTGKKRLA